MSVATAFLSHSSSDKPFVRKVANALCQRGVIPWLDEYYLVPGMSISQKLREALETQTAVALFLSPQALNSRWVTEELEYALQLEAESDAKKNHILPVYLGDAFELVNSSDLLRDRWLDPQHRHVDRLGILCQDPYSASAAEHAAEQIARSIYTLLGFKQAEEINIVVDQRGSGMRIDLYELPDELAEQNAPTLVFRPDMGERTPIDVLMGESWRQWMQTIQKSLATALGRIDRKRTIRILGDFQLGLGFLSGQIFNRTTPVTLYCYNTRYGTRFDNTSQERYGPLLRGGNPECELTAESAGDETLPPKIHPGDSHPVVALFVGKRQYLAAVQAHLQAEGRDWPLAFVETLPPGTGFQDSEQVMNLVRDVVALADRLRNQNHTSKIRLYCDLPNNAIPLLGANLTWHVIESIEFMERPARSASAQEAYVPLPLQAGSDPQSAPEPEQETHTGKKHLVLLDTDHIKKYVFATDKLKEIRGASAMLDELNRIEMETLAQELDPDAQIIYANGGAGLFRVSDANPEDLIRRVQQQYRAKTVSGSITGVSLPESSADNEQELLQHLFLNAQIAKAEPPCIQTIITHPLFKLCESCGVEYAVKTTAELREDEEERPGNTNPELLCLSCFNKRRRDIEIKSEIGREINRLSNHPHQEDPGSQKLWDCLLFGVRDRLNEFTGRSLNRPADLNQLGEMSRPSNYIALIYADGNNMGTIIDNLSVAQLGEFSTTVDAGIRQAVVDAIRGPLWPAPGQACFPFDILLLGGDDLVMVTTAQKAIDAAIKITTSFYAHTKGIRNMVHQQAGEHGPTLSVSVVFIHAKFPFATSLSLAESALKFTKKAFARQRIENANATPQGMINFMVVHSSNTLDFTTLYEQELSDKTRHIYRTLRPYPVDQMERLRNAVKQSLHGIPKTKLHQIREAIFLPVKERATLATFAALLRAKEYEKAEILKIVEDFAGHLGKEHLEYPWYGIEKKEEQAICYYTPLLDAIELYDFIEK